MSQRPRNGCPCLRYLQGPTRSHRRCFSTITLANAASSQQAYPRRGVLIQRRECPNHDRQTGFTVGRMLHSTLELLQVKYLRHHSPNPATKYCIPNINRAQCMHPRESQQRGSKTKIQIVDIIMHYPYHGSRSRAYLRPARLLFDGATLPPIANGSDDSGRVSFFDEATSGCTAVAAFEAPSD